jgi:hypothetical protein
VVQQIKRHGALNGPLSRAAKRAMQMSKVECSACGKQVALRRLTTDHYIVFHPELVETDKKEEG